MKRLIDRGARILVISEELLDDVKVEQMGKGNFQCAAGYVA